MESTNKNRGLVIIYDPHSLQQFLWYYFTHAKEVVWDAFCLPNGAKGTYMTPYCEKAGIFSKVYSGNIDYLQMNNMSKLVLFFKMSWYWFITKKSLFAQNVFHEYGIDIQEYNEVASICETGFITGLTTLFAKTKKVSFFDDGLGEYVSRDRWSNTYKKKSFTYWQSYIMKCMGYGCKGRFYFEPTKDCYKYSAVNSEMKYLNYRAMYGMDMVNTDVDGYNSALKKIYPGIDKISFDKVSAVFFTDDMDVFSDTYQLYYDKCTHYISKEHNAVILKKHPKDMATYKFDDGVLVIEIENGIPAEILLPYIKGKKIYFSMFSSVIIFMQQYGYEYDIFFSNDFFTDNMVSKKHIWKFHSREELITYCERFSKGKYTLIDIDEVG